MAEQQRKKTTPVARSRRRRPAPRGPVRAIRRRLRRLYRRHPQAKSVLRVASASLCLLAVVGLVAWGLLSALPRSDDRVRPVAEIAAPPLTAPVTEAPTAEPTPQPTPDLSRWLQTAAPGPDCPPSARKRAAST